MPEEWEDTTGVTNAIEVSREVGFERNRPCFVVLSGLHLGQTFTLDSAPSMTIGRSRSATIRLVDEGVSRKHVRITAGDDEALWLEDLGSRNGTFCNGKRISHRHELRDGDKIQLGRNTMMRFTFLDSHDESFQRLMYDSALRDGLTRTFNRRYFTDRLRAEFRFAERHGTNLALLMFDLDHFKGINDTHGHVAGDFVLTEFVDAIQSRVRNEDVFARFGGEEFALISRAIDKDDATQLAERLRAAIAELDLAYEGQPIALTVSVGVVCYPDTELGSPAELIAAGDRALYSAKNRGRNCVALYHPGLELGRDDDWHSDSQTIAE